MIDTLGPKVKTNHKRTLARFQFMDAVVSMSWYCDYPILIT